MLGTEGLGYDGESCEGVKPTSSASIALFGRGVSCLGLRLCRLGLQSGLRLRSSFFIIKDIEAIN